MVVPACFGSRHRRPRPSPPSVLARGGGQFAGLYDVGGRKLYLECRGAGSPTVISVGFRERRRYLVLHRGHPPPVLRGHRPSPRVCAYDRPGSIRTLDDAGHRRRLRCQPSDPAPMPRTGPMSLRMLLTCCHSGRARTVPVDRPLAGRSVQSALHRTYRIRSRVVMVDATPPPLKKLLSPQLWKELVQDPLLTPQSRFPIT